MPGMGHCRGFPFSAEVEKIISVNEFVVKDALGETAHDAINENLVLILDAEGDGFCREEGVQRAKACEDTGADHDRPILHNESDFDGVQKIGGPHATEK